MAAGVDLDNLGEGGGNYEPELNHIDEGFNVCRLVSYIELGHHAPIFQGKPQLYMAGKNVGKPRTDELVIHMVFEFPTYEYTGDYPLTIKFSIPFGEDEFLSKLSMTKALEEGWVDKKTALKMNYVKGLLAMQDATKSKKQFHEMIGDVFGCTVTNRLGGKQREDGSIPVFSNTSLASMVPASFKNPVTGVVTEVECPPQIGEYCETFFWDTPTIQSWAKVPKFLQKACLKAKDYKGSALDMLITEFSNNQPAAEGGDHKEPKPPAESKKAPAKPAKTDKGSSTDDIPV
jgi:hypothetical protein